MEESLTGVVDRQSGVTPDPTTEAPTQTADVNTGDKTTQQSAEAAPATTSEDDKLANFAKSQGIDLSNATENERRLAKIAYDNQRAYRTTKSEAHTLNKVAQPTDSSVEARLEAMETRQRLDDFKREHEITPELDQAMGRIYKDTAEKSGEAMAKSLLSNIDLLYRMARTELADATTEAGQRHAQEVNAARQKSVAAPDNINANTGSYSAKPKITREWLRENPGWAHDPETRKMVNDALASGQLV